MYDKHFEAKIKAPFRVLLFVGTEYQRTMFTDSLIGLDAKEVEAGVYHAKLQ